MDQQRCLGPFSRFTHATRVPKNSGKLEPQDKSHISQLFIIYRDSSHNKAN